MTFKDYLNNITVNEALKTDASAIEELRNRYQEVAKKKDELQAEISKLEAAQTTAYFKLGGLAAQIAPDNVDNEKLNKGLEQYDSEIENIEKKLEPLYKKRESLLDELKKISRVANNLVTRNAKKAGVSPLNYVFKHNLSF
ncbi:hypothetical protein ACXG0S_002012 [Campylobacter coli]|nr:hypothetical protein [Campylobacter coli]EDD2124054.1 hypothetical protein [Campylobacter coli]EFS5446210.1 hypothetical protein [Campylobacter coli]ELH4668579.1 hypothetical protein [Campylobacter coli]